MDIGEFPVDVVKVSSTPIISNQGTNGDGLGSTVPSLQNVLFMSPQAGDTWAKRSDMLTARARTAACAANGKKGIAYHRYMARTGFCDFISGRKTVIEPLFNLIIHLLNTTGKDKELPLKGKPNVRSFLLFGVVLTQLALLMNSIYGLDFHDVSHMLTVFL